MKRIRVAYSKGGVDWEHWRQGGSLGPFLGSVEIEVQDDATPEEIKQAARVARLAVEAKEKTTS